jgi:hypothetical protein
MKYKYPFQHPLLLTAASVGLLIMAYCVPGVGEVVKSYVRQALCGPGGDSRSGAEQDTMFIRGGGDMHTYSGESDVLL